MLTILFGNLAKELFNALLVLRVHNVEADEVPEYLNAEDAVGVVGQKAVDVIERVAG